MANRGDSTIEKFDSLGTPTLFANTGLNQPAGLAFDSAGYLYAANQVGGTVEKFNSLGVGTLFGTGLATANEMTFDSAGNLYVADQSIGAIMKFGALGGSASIFSTGAGSPLAWLFNRCPNRRAGVCWPWVLSRFSGHGCWATAECQTREPVRTKRRTFMHPIVWFDIRAANIKRAQKFYSKLFQWKFEQMPERITAHQSRRQQRSQ